MFKYVGRTIEIQYETSYHFKIEYLGENTMRWTSLKERTDGRPMVGEETFYLYQQAEEIYTISWVEETGVSVTSNLNFGKLEAHAFMTWDDASARGGRAALDHKGKITMQ